MHCAWQMFHMGLLDNNGLLEKEESGAMPAVPVHLNSCPIDWSIEALFKLPPSKSTDFLTKKKERKREQETKCLIQL